MPDKRVLRGISKKKISVILLIAGAALITAGIMQGDYRDTLSKAIIICLECIGIG
jgi:predicted MFS family arabinose efflux permease